MFSRPERESSGNTCQPFFFFSVQTNLQHVTWLSQNFVYYPLSGLFGHELLQLALCELLQAPIHVPPRVALLSWWCDVYVPGLVHGHSNNNSANRCGTNGTIVFDCQCVGRPINCDITERAFGICRPEISTRALVNVTEGGGHYPTTMILLGFLTSGLRLPYNLCFPSSFHRQSLSERFSSQWIYRSNRRRRRE